MRSEEFRESPDEISKAERRPSIKIRADYFSETQGALSGEPGLSAVREAKKSSIPEHVTESSDAPDWQARDYTLDSQSSEAARRCGTDLARSLGQMQWNESSTKTKLAAIREIERVVSADLRVPVAPLTVCHLDDQTWGATDRQAMLISSRILDESTLVEALDTIAHEYRHRWQFEVIDGTSDYPAESEIRPALTAAEREYPKDAALFPKKYYTNRLEIDATAFAQLVCLSYDAEVIRRQK